MGESKHEGLAVPGRVMLAHEPPFVIGPLSVDPPTRQVTNDGRSMTLEPRVMQVLVALARANAAIVTRDELIERCWDGRIVTDDAINRVLSRIRHVAEGIGAGAFKLETITKVGYRLTVNGQRPAATAPAAPARAMSAPLPRRSLLVGAGAFAALGLTGLGLWERRKPAYRPDPEALAYYRRGIAVREAGLLEVYHQADAWFRQAVAIDPEFADAWGALALQRSFRLDIVSEADLRPLAEQSRSDSKRALELDPDQPEAIAALAMIPTKFHRWGAAENEMRRVHDSHPGVWMLDSQLGRLMGDVARWDEAIRLLRQVSKSHPTIPYPHIALTYVYLGAGRLEEAAAESTRSLARWPNNPGIWPMHIDILGECGRTSEAVAFAADERARPLRREGNVRLFTAMTQALDTRAEDDIGRFRSMVYASVHQDVRIGAFAALKMSALGAVDEAYELLDAYFFRRGRFAANAPPMSDLSRRDTDFLFFPGSRHLRRDPRFHKLIHALGLNAYWDSIGVAPPHLPR